MPYWNIEIKPLRQDSLWWHWLWIECGKPQTGVVANIMRSTRAKYHKAVKNLKYAANKKRMNRMAEHISNNNTRDLFKEVRKVNCNNHCVSTNVDGANTSDGIADVFRTKYYDLFHKVPTSVEEMSSLKKDIEGKIAEDANKGIFIITVNMVIKAIAMLKSDKTDGSHVNTSLLINSSHMFKVMLTLLFNAMLIHGYTADNLLSSTLVSIPKSLRASLNTSDNYRGIALCSSIIKVLDIVYLCSFSDKLYSSKCQYAYKANHGSTLCTLMLKETANYFVKRNTEVYCCCLDASKAFDYVKFDKLFNLLVQRDIPGVVIRLLLDSYTRQCMYIKWDDVLSEPISVLNGVKQGGILSPLLFSLYYDVLLLKLQELNVGCKIGPDVLNSFAYADDIVLLAPSRSALQSLMSECIIYSAEFKIKFNALKTKCIRFSNCSINNYVMEMTMEDRIIPWETSVNHLGNILSCNLEDLDDINLKIGQFYSQCNKLNAAFPDGSRVVISNLFTKYCSSFYGAQAWDLSKSCINKVYIAWNKAVRRLLKLPYCTHRYLLGPLLQSSNVNVQFVNRFIKLYFNMLNSTNSYIYNMAIRCRSSSNSCMGANALYIYNEFNILLLHNSKCKVINHIQSYVNNINMPYAPCVSAIFHVLDGDLVYFYDNVISSMFLQHLCCD